MGEEQEEQPILIQKEIEEILDEEYNRLIEEYSNNILIGLMLKGPIDNMDLDELLELINNNISSDH